MERQNREPAAGREPQRERGETFLEHFELAVHRDAQRLKNARCRVHPATARNHFLHRLGELERGRERPHHPSAPAASSASAWPPPPSVPSTMILPGWAARSSTVSASKTDS